MIAGRNAAREDMMAEIEALRAENTRLKGCAADISYEDMINEEWLKNDLSCLANHMDL